MALQLGLIFLELWVWNRERRVMLCGSAGCNGRVGGMGVVMRGIALRIRIDRDGGELEYEGL